MELCDRCKEKICTQEEKGIFIVKREEKEDIQVCILDSCQSAIRMGGTCFEQIFMISHVERELDKLQKLIWKQIWLSIRLDKISEL